MKVSADLKNGYLFELENDDFNYIPRAFLSSLTPVLNGLAFQSVEDLPDLFVSGLPVITGVLPLVPTFTHIARNKNQELIDHNLVVDGNSGLIVSLQTIALMRPDQRMVSSGRQFEANHIPQIMRGFSGAKIHGVNGRFNWKRRYFYGDLFFGG